MFERDDIVVVVSGLFKDLSPEGATPYEFLTNKIRGTLDEVVSTNIHLYLKEGTGNSFKDSETTHSMKFCAYFEYLDHVLSEKNEPKTFEPNDSAILEKVDPSSERLVSFQCIYLLV